MSVDPVRVRVLKDAPLKQRGGGVLYWMTSARRTVYNAGLEQAFALASELQAPLLVVEPLRLRYRYACPRFHTFIIQGMRDNARAFAAARIRYYPYVERAVGESAGMFRAFAETASVVVLDEHPAFHYPALEHALLQSVADTPTRVLSVDSNGLMPLRSVQRRFQRAVDFRRYIQKNVGVALDFIPQHNCMAAGAKRAQVSTELQRRFTAVTERELKEPEAWVNSLSLRGASAAVDMVGGSDAASLRLDAFIDNGLVNYADRNHPDCPVQSLLSPYLHFGHISAHQVFNQVAEREGWERDSLSTSCKGQREGFWGMGQGAEGFLDQLLTWRELGFNRCIHEPRLYNEYAGLPSWARATLAQHATDQRPVVYSLQELEAAATHDTLWNAAQRQLVTEGAIHNYLRMLWGKKVLEWSPSPEQAFEWLKHLNDKYALDGRDPNSYSGVSWIFGCFDRAWGPERPIFGKVRYMSSDNTRRKLRLKEYLARYDAGAGSGHTLSLFSS